MHEIMIIESYNQSHLFYLTKNPMKISTPRMIEISYGKNLDFKIFGYFG